MTCEKCGRDIDERENVWTAVKGWEKRRQQGGTNYIALRERTGEVMCLECMARLLAGLNLRQESLL